MDKIDLGLGLDSLFPRLRRGGIAWSVESMCTPTYTLEKNRLLAAWFVEINKNWILSMTAASCFKELSSAHPDTRVRVSACFKQSGGGKENISIPNRTIACLKGCVILAINRM